MADQPRIVAFDTCVLVWTIQAVQLGRIPLETPAPATSAANLERAALHVKAAALVAKLTAEKIAIALPAVVVGELLCIVPETFHDATMVALARGFMIHPYDHATARKAAELHRRRLADGTYRSIKNARLGEEGLRAKLKADTMIVATAMRWGVDTLYSHDGDIAKIAKGGLHVAEMPPRSPEQTELTAMRMNPTPKR